MRHRGAQLTIKRKSGRRIQNYQKAEGEIYSQTRRETENVQKIQNAKAQ